MAGLAVSPPLAANGVVRGAGAVTPVGGVTGLAVSPPLAKGFTFGAGVVIPTGEVAAAPPLTNGLTWRAGAVTPVGGVTGLAVAPIDGGPPPTYDV